MTAFEDRPSTARSGTQLAASHDDSTLRIDGAIDVSSIDSFHQILRDVADCSVIDLSGVSFFGAVGVRPLVELQQRFGGEIITSRAVDRVLQILGIDTE